MLFLFVGDWLSDFVEFIELISLVFKQSYRLNLFVSLESTDELRIFTVFSFKVPQNLFFLLNFFFQMAVFFYFPMGLVANSQKIIFVVFL